MTDIIFGAILIIILGMAAGYIFKEKKKGNGCIGCPMAKTCASAQAKGGMGCGCSSDIQS